MGEGIAQLLDESLALLFQLLLLGNIQRNADNPGNAPLGLRSGSTKVRSVRSLKIAT
jgi:hypothetical protein